MSAKPSVTAFLDTEFTTLDITDNKLISLALVVHGGPEFYVEINDTWTEDECSDFTKEVVLPQLDLATHGKSEVDAREALHEWLNQFEIVNIISDAPLWDWKMLIKLAGEIDIGKHIVPKRYEWDGVEDTPHHALLDARMIAEYCMTHPKLEQVAT